MLSIWYNYPEKSASDEESENPWKGGANLKTKHHFFQKFVDQLTGIFFPIINGITAASILKSVMILLVNYGVIDQAGGMYQIFYAVSDGFFYFLPFFLALTAAEQWKADASKTVKEALVEQIAVIGENLNIRRFEKVTAANGCVVSYTHGGGRIGVIVEADTDVVNDAIKEAMTNVAMQIAALSPKYVSRSEVSAEYIAHEKEILLAQIMNDPKESQKPEKVINGMIEGRVSKELKEICLLDQVYVKAEDGKQTVGKYIDQVAKDNGAKFSIKRFVRFETGEGLEKKNEDFAAEVAAQMAGN